MDYHAVLHYLIDAVSWPSHENRAEAHVAVDQRLHQDAHPAPAVVAAKAAVPVPSVTPKEAA